MNKVKGVFIFVLGATVGSILTWQYTKKYYEQRNQEDINSVKETYSKKPMIYYDAKPVMDTYEEKHDISQYSKILEQERYAREKSKPHVISPDEFGEFDEYDQISLTYYADQVLADENDEEIKDVDNVVGVESLTHFGEYEDDSVYVRNDRLKCDYEILMDTRVYSEVLKHRPHQRGD